MAPLDELDTKLIELLQRDGRASNIELARKTGVSEGTIRRRFRNLVQRGSDPCGRHTGHFQTR